MEVDVNLDVDCLVGMTRRQVIYEDLSLLEFMRLRPGPGARPPPPLPSPSSYTMAALGFHPQSLSRSGLSFAASKTFVLTAAAPPLIAAAVPAGHMLTPEPRPGPNVPTLSRWSTGPFVEMATHTMAAPLSLWPALGSATLAGFSAGATPRAVSFQTLGPAAVIAEAPGSGMLPASSSTMPATDPCSTPWIRMFAFATPICGLLASRVSGVASRVSGVSNIVRAAVARLMARVTGILTRMLTQTTPTPEAPRRPWSSLDSVAPAVAHTTTPTPETSAQGCESQLPKKEKPARDHHFPHRHALRLQRKEQKWVEQMRETERRLLLRDQAATRSALSDARLRDERRCAGHRQIQPVCAAPAEARFVPTTPAKDLSHRQRRKLRRHEINRRSAAVIATAPVARAAPPSSFTMVANDPPLPPPPLVSAKPPVVTLTASTPRPSAALAIS
jgi:hypothetical protein